METFPLSLKPVTPPFTGKRVIHPTTTAILALTDGTESTSKNLFKRLRNKWTGKRIPFCMDDWVEKDYPAEGGDNILLLGACKKTDEFRNVRHNASGTVSMKALGLTLKTIENQSKWTGLISSMDFNAKTKCINIVFIDLKPLLTLELVH